MQTKPKIFSYKDLIFLLKHNLGQASLRNHEICCIFALTFMLQTMKIQTARFWSICLLLLATNCAQNPKDQQAENVGKKNTEAGTTITLSGTFKNAQKTKVKLQKFIGEKYETIDSTVANGKDFSFKIKVSEAEFFKLRLFDDLEIPLVLNPKQTQVKILFANQDAENRYEIQGSDDSIHYITLDALFANFRNQIVDLQKADAKAISETEKATIQKTYKSYQEKSIQQLKALIDTIQPSIVGLVGLESLEYETEKAYIEKVFQNYQKNLPASAYTKRFEQRLAQIKQKYGATEHLSVGKVAPNIELETPEGKLATLASLRGKVVLIDFWASWCKPCRMENPNVVRLYKQYKSKGFEVFSVSLDTKRDAWLKAIADDKLTWQHVVEMNQAQTGVSKTYAVESIPTTYLLDKEGKIIARNLRGQELENKLAEVLQ